MLSPIAQIISFIIIIAGGLLLGRWVCNDPSMKKPEDNKYNKEDDPK